jgi:hypothetical protein
MSQPSKVLEPSAEETAGRRVAIIQSGYLPWKGHFDIIHDVDFFVFLDDVQFTLRDWRTRNRLKTPRGPAWLTIPVGSHRDLCIDEVRIPGPGWQERHWSTIRHNYGRAPFFGRYRAFFEEVYLGHAWESLSRLNQYLTVAIARDLLGIRTEFMDARPLATHGRKTTRLLQILKKCEAQTYITGPTTRSYLDVGLLAEAGIQAIFKNFDGYPEYRQSHPPFDHFVSVVDLLFNVGPEAPWYIWGWREGGTQRKVS